ncbi:PREDICTED: PML-RARA-regulated adapter molecule 1 [Ceratotherium simum simum]|uniref:PML-RARA-regulated adapter molecule 1 n=1 Tax=Ceratotherium simum simum TaxID=73337 RepID=A0ABM1C6P2_CERSS|nr:PREDICTED: PML-RARA-regulated adapter molecule 1 [Ceratotherium simum simum]
MRHTSLGSLRALGTPAPLPGPQSFRRSPQRTPATPEGAPWPALPSLGFRFPSSKWSRLSTFTAATKTPHTQRGEAGDAPPGGRAGSLRARPTGALPGGPEGLTQSPRWSPEVSGDSPHLVGPVEQKPQSLPEGSGPGSGPTRPTAHHPPAAMLPKKPPQPEFGDLTRTSSEPEVSVVPKRPQQSDFKALSKKPPQPELGGLPRTSSEPEVSLLPRNLLQLEVRGAPRKFSQPEPRTLLKKHMQAEFFGGLPRKPPLPGSVSESSLPTAVAGCSPRFPLSPGFGARQQRSGALTPSRGSRLGLKPRRRPLPSVSILGPPPAKPPLPPGPRDIQSFRRPSAAATALRRTHSSTGIHFQARPSADALKAPDETYELYDDVEATDDSSPSPRVRGLLVAGPGPPPARVPEEHSVQGHFLPCRRSAGGQWKGPMRSTPCSRAPIPLGARKEKAPQPQQLPATDPKVLKQIRKAEKAEREFRKKFKFEGEIVIQTRMMIDPNAKTRRGGGKHLGIRRGEILEVIEFTNNDEMLCRDTKGKYGYVPRTALLPLETEVYDDVAFWDPLESQPLPRER